MVNKLKNLRAVIAAHKFAFTAIWSVIINLIVECLSRHGLIEGVVHMFTSPYIFALNAIIIALTLSFVFLFKRRRFLFVFVSFVWLLAGTINFIVLFFRKSPFTANDFLLINDAMKIMDSYVNVLGIILIVAGFVLAITGVVYYWWKSKVTEVKINYIKIAGSIGILWGILYGMIWLGFLTGQLSNQFGNITLAFDEYGFAYCFTNSILENGIEEPPNYKEEDFKEIDEIMTNPITEIIEEEEEYPNIIFLQLESFMNPYLIKDVEFSINPVPNFRKLYSQYPSGYLYVPSFGAGTANTEFEVITGMNLDDFGTGEYPYMTVLKNTTSESICYNLKSSGYTSHALHNNDGSFYSRYRVFPNLGFDTFTSIEYMEECERNPVGWAKDKELIQYVTKILNSTENQDFIYAISVQGHGDYPETYEELEALEKENPVKYRIETTEFFDENAVEAFEYYLGQLKEMDDFVGSLIKELEERDEKTILVMYGDHLPGFEFTDENLKSEDIYKSQYVIWSSYDVGLKNKHLEAYQLSSHVLEALGIDDGIINRYHQKYKESEDYLENLTLLEYDMLFGDKKIYENQHEYVPTEIKMGIKEISISDVYNYNGRTCIEGSNFNQYSFVTINGKEYDTECINPHTLVVPDIRLEYGDEVTVVQHGKDGLVLSSTEKAIYHPE